MVLCGDLITTMMTCGSLLDPIWRTPGWFWVSEVKIRLTYSYLFSRDSGIQYCEYMCIYLSLATAIFTGNITNILRIIEAIKIRSGKAL